MSKFQVILLAVFGVFIVAAVLLFSFSRGGGSSQAATVTVWGELPIYDFGGVLTNSGLKADNLTIVYEAKPAEQIEQYLLEALATGNGPDLVIMSVDKFWKEKNKLIPIPYGSVSERSFKSTFIEEGELYLGQDGIYALPFSVDPLVLYYNRDILSSVGIAKPLSYWDEIYASALNLSKRDAAGNLSRSAIALGESRNISHAKDILSLLMLQAGTPITSYINGELRSVMTDNFNLPLVPSEAALDFYTQFSNPSKPYYSWNRSLPDAQTRFTAGDSAYYIGYASEYRELRNKNPTLNFAVSLMPQSRVSGKSITFGKLYGISITRDAKNPSAALQAATKLASKSAGAAFSSALTLPPVRRDLLSDKPSDDAFSVFYDAALQSKGWLDPDTKKTRTLFGDMIESVTSGRARTTEAVGSASRSLEALINP